MTENGRQKPQDRSILDPSADGHKMSPSTKNQAINALVFLYRKALDQPPDGMIDAVRAEVRGRRSEVRGRSPTSDLGPPISTPVPNVSITETEPARRGYLLLSEKLHPFP